MAIQYRFKKPQRQFKIGDILPPGRDSGTIATMLAAHVIEVVPDEPTTSDPVGEAVPGEWDHGDNKAIKTGSAKVKRK